MKITARQLKNLIREHVDESPLTVEFLEWRNEGDQSSWTLLVNGDEDGHWLTGRPDANYLADMIVGGWAREQDPPLDDRSQEYDDIVDNVEGQLTQQPAFNQALKDAIRAHENYEEQERGLYEHMQESKGLSKKIHHRGRRMKITKSQLKQIIEEEIDTIYRENLNRELIGDRDKVYAKLWTHVVSSFSNGIPLWRVGNEINLLWPDEGTYKPEDHAMLAKIEVDLIQRLANDGLISSWYDLGEFA